MPVDDDEPQGVLLGLLRVRAGPDVHRSHQAVDHVLAAGQEQPAVGVGVVGVGVALQLVGGVAVGVDGEGDEDEVFAVREVVLQPLHGAA